MNYLILKYKNRILSLDNKYTQIIIIFIIITKSS